ncbi:WbqC family protein [Panacibacter ginsenosidivorans]|uniref:WbqC family protein n=1 Tax=Panacibacter ginsenosidivorans TaxID=1813871 RepID=A0A5B8VF14_9BACT|nr:WbqC family protein [Panacibacter ginsenosidivorans]QEC70010.1 WbqC family protein [Panacibacter ginsenosidivorans]
MKNGLIIENQYFPIINWFKYSFQEKYIILDGCEAYKKMSFRNRMVVCGSNGLISLSVPIESGRRQKAPFKDVRISYREKWMTNHWRTIFSCYGKSPFFDYYSHEVEKLLYEKHIYLFDLNLAAVEWLKTVLHFPAEIIVVDFDNAADYNSVADDISDKWRPNNFQQEDIFIQYPQVFQDRIGFQPNLSILDMLFNMGPSAMDLLKY